MKNIILKYYILILGFISASCTESESIRSYPEPEVSSSSLLCLEIPILNSNLLFIYISIKYDRLPMPEKEVIDAYLPISAIAVYTLCPFSVW